MVKSRFRLQITAAGGEFIRPLGRCFESEVLATAQRVAIYAPGPTTVRVQRGRQCRDVETLRATFHPSQQRH